MRRQAANSYHVGWDRTRERLPDRVALSDVMLRLAMSRGKVHHPVHNVEAPAKRRKTSPTIGIAIDTPKVMQCPGLRRRLKSQQQPRSSGAGLASETAAEHRRRHSKPQPSCPRCMYMRSSWQPRSSGAGLASETAAEHRCRHCKRAIRGARGIAGAWSSFDVCALSQVARRGVRQHAETLTHRLATQAYFAPPVGEEGHCR